MRHRQWLWLAIAAFLSGAIIWILVHSRETRHREPYEAPAKRPRLYGRPALASSVELPPADHFGDDPVGHLRLEGIVFGPDEVPVPHAVVSISTMPPRDVVTGEDGTFVLEGLLARDYYLRARKGSLASQLATVRMSPTTEPVLLVLSPGGVLEVVVVDATTRKAIPDALVSAEWFTTVSVRTNSEGEAEFPGMPVGPVVEVSATATGFATAHRVLTITRPVPHRQRVRIGLVPGTRVSGAVLTPDGKPIGAALVYAERLSGGPREEPRNPVVTDASGAWYVDVSAGSYEFTAVHPDFGPGTSGTVAITKEAAPPMISITLTPGARLVGMVVDKSGRPAPAALVSISPPARDPAVQQRSARYVHSDTEGAFSFSGLPAGEVVIAATTPDASSSPQVLSLQRGENGPVTIKLAHDHDIVGVLTYDDGDAIADATVSAAIVRAGGDSATGVYVRPAYAVTMVDGTFRLSGLAPGEYSLTARKEYPLRLLDPVTADTSTEGPVKLVVSRAAVVSGRVAFEDGTAVKEATVSAGLAHQTLVDNNGTFTLEVPTRISILQVTGAQFSPTHFRMPKLVAGENRDVGTITVSRGGVLTGRVTLTDRSPVGGAVVTAGRALREGRRGISGNRSTESNTDGTFRLEGLPAGEMNLIAVSATHGRSRIVRVTPTSETTVVDLVIEQEATLEGVVLRGSTPVEARVVARSADGTAQFASSSDASGKYVLSGLPAGRYAVTASAMTATMAGISAESREHSVELAAGQTERLDIVLRPGREIRVRVIPHPGEQLVFVSYHWRSGTFDAETWADLQRGNGGVDWNADGPSAADPLTLRDVEPGTYTICVRTLLASQDIREEDLWDVVATEDYPVDCEGVTVAEQPQVQEVVVESPP